MKIELLSRLQRGNRVQAEARELATAARAARLELCATRAVQGLLSGRHRSRLLGSSVEFSEHRPYQPGDDLRRLDWRVFARSDRLLVRRTSDESALPLALLLDTSASMDYGKPRKRRVACRAAAVLGALALDQGDSVRLAWGAERLESLDGPLSGRTAVAPLCGSLAGARFAGRTDLGRLVREVEGRLPRRSLIVLLSDLLGEVAPSADVLAALCARGHELAVIQILDATELDLPSTWGRLQLSDPEGGLEDLWVDAPRQRESYRQALHEHLEAWQRVIHAARGDHLLIVTGRPLLDGLAPWIARRRQRSRRSATMS